MNRSAQPLAIKSILFVPSNASHVATQVPVAKELVRRGWNVMFLSRDHIVENDYKVETCLHDKGFQVVRGPSFYVSDFGRHFPEMASYRRLRTEVSIWLLSNPADAVVVCNDDTALFDRMIVDVFACGGKPAFLIQESVRPAIRPMSLRQKVRQQGYVATACDIMKKAFFRAGLGPFFRKGYGHSNVTSIFVAGKSFGRSLVADGVRPSKVIVTGQPRLDRRAGVPEGFVAKTGNRRVLLYCHQPVKCSQDTQDQLVVDVVKAAGTLPGVKVMIKLHPRDLPEDHWRSRLEGVNTNHLIDISRARPLRDCFMEADAMMTIASTTSLEAMDWGLPVGLIDYLPIEWYLPYIDSGGALSVRSPAELPSVMTSLLFDERVRQSLCQGAERVLGDELFLRDGRSAERIAVHIIEKISERQVYEA